MERHRDFLPTTAAAANQTLIQGIESLIGSPYWWLLSPTQRQNWQDQLSEFCGTAQAPPDSGSFDHH